MADRQTEGGQLVSIVDILQDQGGIPDRVFSMESRWTICRRHEAKGKEISRICLTISTHVYMYAYRGFALYSFESYRLREIYNHSVCSHHYVYMKRRRK